MLSALRLLKLPLLATLHVWLPTLLLALFLYQTGEEPDDTEVYVPIITSGFVIPTRDEDTANAAKEEERLRFTRREKKVRLQGLNLEVTVLLVEEEGSYVVGGFILVWE